uniref:Uncharacterized protein n=1 Tax=Hyaloperonospora arabidopsidis (strain Emoy2) TaxID=559515 RepID=M4BF92_HYAAE
MAPLAPPRLEELILFGTDVGVLNHTTLSLWHFQQLMRELLQSEAAAEPEEEEQDEVDSAATERVLTPARGVELGEGMSVAAVLYEKPMHGCEAEKSSSFDVTDKFGDTINRTEERSGLPLQGVAGTIKGNLTPTTRVAATFRRYRCVLCLDASPSILSIDPSSGRLFLDLLPELYVSVLVQGALVESLCVLMQGYIVTSTNAASFLQLIKERFELIENDWASQAQERGQWGYLGNAAPAPLDWILENMVFALNSLPTDCAPIMVLVTDGVVDVRDVFSYDNILMQLVRHDIQCHFLRIGGDGENELNATFGFVPDTHLLRFVSEYTGGTVFDYETVFEACYGTSSTSSNIVKRMTGLQDALFLRKSSVHANSAPVVKLNAMDSTSFDGKTLLPLHPYRMWREKVHEYRIYADVNRIVEARLREGFSMNKIYVKTYKQPETTKGGLNQAGVGSPRDGNAPPSNSSEQSSEATKFLFVFLLQWKENVWLEYVVSTTIENSAAPKSSTSAATGRRVSGQGVSGLTSPTAARSAAILSNDKGAAWSEWYVKMNILGYADFLRAFENAMQRLSASGDRRAAIGEDPSTSSPIFIHDFVRNVQDVDRVLLHLMTATTSICETSDSAVNQFSFGTNHTSATANPKITSSHPVFNIIGDLSTLLWHRWFFLERFEILSVVKSDACTDLFYRSATYSTEDRGSVGLRLRGPENSSRMIHSHGASMYNTSNGHVSIGIESCAEPLIAILTNWSSQKLSQDLFLKFLRPTGTIKDKAHVPPRATIVPSTITSYGGLAQRRRQRSQNSSIGEGVTHGEDSSSANESNAALCFVRLEFKNKTLCAIHVAFFATKASTRRQVLDDLKSTIFAGIYEVAVPTPSKLLSSSLTETPVILCHRMLSRLFVTHDTLLLHGNDQKSRPFNFYAASPTLDADHNAGVLPPSNTCCGGSELKLHRVFGAYVWHSSWKWEVPNLATMSNVMRRLHEARVSCGFWVLDWKISEGDDEQGTHIESVIFGREILMENENGRIKTALVQYGLRRVSDTCLMTSFWMEPQHGVVKTRLSDEADRKDRFHWSLKQAIGHDTPFENYEGDPHRSSTRATVGHMYNSSVDDDVKSVEQEGPNTDSNRDFTYLDESELLHLIRGYLYKSDRHSLSCMHTFDCIIHFRENTDQSNQSSTDIDGVIGSTWSVDRQLAAESGMILPPFSTARLLATSKRSTEHFLMYLQCDKEPTSRVDESRILEFPVSPANENLYSMLEVTLRGLSDCEVAWADYNGDVANQDMTSPSNDDRFDKAGMDGQLPLWLKQQLSLTFESRKPHHALSKGKCFAKLVSSDCVVLAFFPSLDTLQIENKTDIEPLLKNNGEVEDKPFFETRFDKFRMSSGDDSLSQQFSVQSAEEDGPNSRGVRMSVSADDIVLYQERRRSFREGYKSWRMGHYQGSRDAKQSYGRDFRKLRLPSTPEDHEFCEEISRQASYGCDFHLLIESADGVMGSGFFQVAFYECSLSRLSTDLHDTSKQTCNGVDSSQSVLKHLFFSTKTDKKLTRDRTTIPLSRGQHKPSPARSLSSSKKHQLGADSVLESRRFRKKIKRAHEHNFSRGVYMALRAGGTVQHSDLLQALSSCVEIPVDFDVTLLYHMMEIAASQKVSPLSPVAAAVISAGMGADILQEKLTKSFETILSSVFAPITGTKYYYFTGNENTVYEELTANEYELHILMEDSDDDEVVAESRNSGRPGGNDGTYSLQEQDVNSSDAEQDSETFRHRLEESPDVNSVGENDTAEKDPTQSRRDSLRSDLSPSADGFTEERLVNEENSGTVEEDAEFNKDVAVATSSFSVPFFLRFECRVLNSSRETRTNSADTHALGLATLLRRSSSSAAYEDVRKEMIAQAQVSLSSSRQEEFSAFLELLKTSQGSQPCSNGTGVSHIAESFLDVPPSRIALRLVTMTLPNESEIDGRRVAPHVPFVMDTYGSQQAGMTNTLPSISPNFATLHRFQCQVLRRIRQDIKEWCSIEILSILKSANEITPAIGALVRRLFDDLPVLAVTNAKYPLEFVTSSQETSTSPLDLFKQEFEKGDLLNVHRCNGLYFVVETMRSTERPDGASENRSGATFEIPYWAYFEFGAGHISLRYHHHDYFGVSGTGLSRLQVLTRLQLGIRAICRRVNQSLLLLQLHETRTCNHLLLPPDGDPPSCPQSPKQRAGLQRLSDSTDEKDDPTKQGIFFWPGQFECDLCYSAFFKLHERLTPNFALNMLCTSALEQFQVHNRRHLFVYRDRDGHVFYMKISISYNVTLSREAGRQLGKERPDHSCPARSSVGGIIDGGATSFAATTASGGPPGILLKVFGVSEAGEEVTNELCHLLERKLDEATQVVLMKLLARNTKFQLSQSDLAFLCPPATEPSSDVYYNLPGEVPHCYVLLHYLSQTLKLASYIRPVTSGGSAHMQNMRGAADNSWRVARRGSVTSAENSVGPLDEDFGKDVAQEKSVPTKDKEDTKLCTSHDSAHIHPAYFGSYPRKNNYKEDDPFASFDAATRSPVFFVAEREAGGESGASNNVTSTVASPEIVAQASYVMNLNPDLRLSQGFLSRVGKGLALMRVDLIRKNFAATESVEDRELKDLEEVRDTPRLAALYSSSINSDDALVARCQIWTRGSIVAVELSYVVKAFLNEAVHDYHIEETIKNLQQQDASCEAASVLSGNQVYLPSGVSMLVSLFKSACLLPSSSVTKLGGHPSVAPWDLNNVMAQVRSFLCCLPRHLRPVVYAKSLSGSYDFVSSCDERLHMSSRTSGPPPTEFRLIVQHVCSPDVDEGADSSDSDAETTASVCSTTHHIEPLMRTDSIHSEISDIDSVSGRTPLAWASISGSYDSNANSQILNSPSVSSTTLSMVGMTGGGQSQSHLQRGIVTEKDVLLYVNNCSTHRRRRRSLNHEYREVKRSFYYVVDLSINKGLRLYGYNMSSSLVEALTTHIARVLTWSMLRERLLRSLLLEKSGLSTAAPVGAMVLQPSGLVSAVERMEHAGKGSGKNLSVLCRDSAVHFIEYRPCVLSILQSNEWFPRVLDTVRLRSVEGTSLGVYLREAQTQPTTALVDTQYQRPRGKGSTCLGVLVGPSSIPDLTREVSEQSLSQRSVQSNGDSSVNLLGGQSPGKAKGGCVASSSNASDIVPSSSPSRRLPSKDRGEAARMRGGTGATTALMAARARARGGGGFPNRTGVLGAGASRTGGNSPAVMSSDTVAPWDLPLSNTKAPRLLTSADESDVKIRTDRDGSQTAGTEIDSTVKPATSTNRSRGVNRHVRRGSRGNGITDPGLPSSSSSLSGLPLAKPSARRIGSNEALLADPSRIHSSWKTRLEVAWGPRFMFPGNTERWVTSVPLEQRQHFIELEEAEDEGQPRKNLAPLSFFCSALEKRWEMFEKRSTIHTVGMQLLEKLASSDAKNEMTEEPVAKDVVAHLMQSGHLLLHQRFRAAFVEQWTMAEVTRTREGVEVVDNRLSDLQSCLDLVHLLRYKRKFMFDQDKCFVAKLYAEHTVESVGAGTGADVWAMQQQVAANMEPLRLEVASDFYKEYAVHLHTLGFRRLRTLDTSTKHARAFSVDHAAAENENEVPGVEGFSEYFYHPERTAANGEGWNVDSNESCSDSYSLATVLLEVRCDNHGVRLTAVLVSLHDLEQQDLQLQTPLAVTTGKYTAATSGLRVYCVAAWLRAQLQTQALIYGFTIRYFQQHILLWINASYDFHHRRDRHGHCDNRHLSEDDAIVSASLVPWKKAATFQNIVKGLQRFLVAFPDLPEKTMKSSAVVSTPLSTIPTSDGSNNTVRTNQLNDSRASSSCTASAPSGHDSHRPTSRVVTRFARRVAKKLHQQRPASDHPTTPAASGALDKSAIPPTSSASAATQKYQTPLSSLWHDCVLRVATVALLPSFRQSNCSELILVQNLLRYIACHASRYDVLDLLQFGTPDAVVCHSLSGSFFNRSPATMASSMPGRHAEAYAGYSLVITTQSLTHKCVDKDVVQLLLLKSTPSELGVGSEVLPEERALQEAQLFTRELLRVATHHYERDLLWSRLLFDDARDPEADLASTLALPSDLFRAEIGPQQLEECLRLSIRTPLELLDPRLGELLRVSSVCWQELAMRLRDLYTDQLREFQFEQEDENSSHLLLLCPDTFDLVIHLTFITSKDQAMVEAEQDGAVEGNSNKSMDSPSRSSSILGNQFSRASEQINASGVDRVAEGDMCVEICRREEPTNKEFTLAQRRSISEFVNCIVHWQWRSLIYD